MTMVLQLYPDNFAKREMMLFTVACRNKKLKGCDWKGPLGNIQVKVLFCSRQIFYRIY